MGVAISRRVGESAASVRTVQEDESSEFHSRPGAPASQGDFSHQVVYDREAVGLGDGGELVEQDTEDAEDVPNLAALFLPPPDPRRPGDGRTLPTVVAKFSLSYSMEALTGWVKQPSPCCAAASVAGAWNAVAGWPRGHPNALDHKIVLKVLHALVSEEQVPKFARFERLLGAPIGPLLKELELWLEARGTPLGKRGAPTKVQMLSVLEEIVRETVEAKRAEVAAKEAREKMLAASEEEVGVEDEARFAKNDELAEKNDTKRAPLLGQNASDAEKNAPSGGGNTGGAARGSAVRGPEILLACERLLELFEEDEQCRATAGAMEHPAEADEEYGELDGDSLLKGSGASPEDVAEVMDAWGWRGPRQQSQQQPQPQLVDEPLVVEDMEDEPQDAQHESAPKKGVVLQFDFGTTGGKLAVRKKRGKAKAKSARRAQGKATAQSSYDDVDGGDEFGGADASCETKWQWRKEIKDILHNTGGLAKLANPNKPSTALIGNWGILAAVRALQEQNDQSGCIVTAVTGELQASVGGTDSIRGGQDGKKNALKEAAPSAVVDDVATIGAMADSPQEHAARCGGIGNVSARLLMGRGRGPRKSSGEEVVGLRNSDSPAARDNAWATLRSAFLAPRTALIFHLKNHYALIFALREWEEDVPAMESAREVATEALGGAQQDEHKPAPLPAKAKVEEPDTLLFAHDPSATSGTVSPQRRRRRVVRQLLTARKGQRPSVWMSFDEAVQIMLSWDGYKIISIHLEEAL